MRRFNRLLPYASCLLLAALGAAPPATTTLTPDIDPQRFLNHIKYLASGIAAGRCPA